jgi:hypothetical protein
MFVPFKSLPENSRIWIYQSSRKFNSDEILIISDALSAFTDQWKVHGIPMPSSFEIRFDQFIILAADENATAASGCSIDDSVRMIKLLGEKLGLELFDRTRIAFKKEDEIITIPLDELRRKYLEGVWSHQTLVVNNLISTKQELSRGWLIPAEASWLKRYMPDRAVVR